MCVEGWILSLPQVESLAGSCGKRLLPVDKKGPKEPAGWGAGQGGPCMSVCSRDGGPGPHPGWLVPDAVSPAHRLTCSPITSILPNTLGQVLLVGKRLKWILPSVMSSPISAHQGTLA